MGHRPEALVELVSNKRISIQVVAAGKAVLGAEAGETLHDPLHVLDPSGKMDFVSLGNWDLSGPGGPSMVGPKGEWEMNKEGARTMGGIG